MLETSFVDGLDQTALLLYRPGCFVLEARPPQ